MPPGPEARWEKHAERNMKLIGDFESIKRFFTRYTNPRTRETYAAFL